MRFKFIKHPATGKEDPMLTMSVLAVGAAIAKFLLDGVTFYFHGQMVNLGHADAMTYGTLLAPILGTHGYLQGITSKKKEPINESQT